MDVKTAIQDLVWENYIQEDEPIVVFGDFAKYEETADELSKGATRILIWALHGTPLAPLPIDESYLTNADVSFRDHKCNNKFRVVVFEYGKDIRWYIKAQRRSRGEQVRVWWGKQRLETAALRVKAFEEAVTKSGKLLFTATDILDSRLKEYKYSKLDAGYVSSDEHDTYCFHSPLSLRSGKSAKALRQTEKIIIFKLSANKHIELPALPFYCKVLKEVEKHPKGSGAFFVDPQGVGKNVRWYWPIKRTIEITWSWLIGAIDRTFERRRVLYAIIKVIVIVAIVGFGMWSAVRKGGLLCGALNVNCDIPIAIDNKS